MHVRDRNRALRHGLGERGVHTFQQVVLLGVRNDQIDVGQAGGGGRIARVAAGEDGAQAVPPSPPGRLARGAGGGVGDGAGVDDVEVGVGERSHHLVAGGQELAGEAFDLRLVQLAAEICKINAHPGILAPLPSVHAGELRRRPPICGDR
jgi:hypothetical protein